MNDNEIREHLAGTLAELRAVDDAQDTDHAARVMNVVADLAAERSRLMRRARRMFVAWERPDLKQPLVVMEADPDDLADTDLWQPPTLDPATERGVVEHLAELAKNDTAASGRNAATTQLVFGVAVTVAWLGTDPRLT